MFRFDSAVVEVRLIPRTPSVALLVEGAFKSPIRLLKTLCVVPPEIMMPFVVIISGGTTHNVFNNLIGDNDAVRRRASASRRQIADLVLEDVLSRRTGKAYAAN